MRRSRVRAVLLAVLAVASGLPACIDPLGDFGKDDCRTDADCPSELTCIDGMFGTFCGCDDDGDCRDGSHCRWGICADNCLFEYECQPSETCWQGKCQAGCQNDQGCEAGFRCTSEGALGKCAPANRQAHGARL